MEDWLLKVWGDYTKKHRKPSSLHGNRTTWHLKCALGFLQGLLQACKPAKMHLKISHPSHDGQGKTGVGGRGNGSRSLQREEEKHTHKLTNLQTLGRLARTWISSTVETEGKHWFSTASKERLFLRSFQQSYGGVWRAGQHHKRNKFEWNKEVAFFNRMLRISFDCSRIQI